MPLAKETLSAVLNTPASRLTAAVNLQCMQLPPRLRARVEHRLARLCAMRWSARLWQRDATLWTGADEDRWLGWLDPWQQANVMRRYQGLCARLRGQGHTDAVVLGMGGASLGAQVLARSLPPAQDGLRLHVLDSTDPDEVRALQARLPAASTLYLVASKSGSTLESALLARHFHARAVASVGRERAGRHFCAITDPGSPLQAQAEALGYAAVFLGDPAIGGRYSVLSPFGMVPLALMGHDPIAFLREAHVMRGYCGPKGRGNANPGLKLGALLGEAALMGHDKITLRTTPDLAPLADWLEQLLAESTGKNGRGLVPVWGEGPARAYGADRLFVELNGPGPRPADDRPPPAGHPVLRIDIDSPQSLAQEFYRWQYATAVAGHILGVHPFDQPDVEATKTRARGLLAQPLMPARGQRYGSLLVEADEEPQAAVARWLAARPEGYFALLAYLPRNPTTEAALARWQRLLNQAQPRPVTAAFGPRYLHACGQVHKGGPPTGAYLFIRMAAYPPGEDGQPQPLAACHAAQAEADMRELRSRGRPCIAIRCTAGLAEAAADISRLLNAALAEAGLSRDAASCGAMPAPPPAIRSPAAPAPRA